MISRFYCGEVDQRLDILEYDGTKCSGRYRAVIDGDQATVLQLQSVDTKDVPLSHLALCPGLTETEVLEILSQDDTRSLACSMFLIERVEEDILYRSRDCQLLHDKKLSGKLCESCHELIDKLQVSNNDGERNQNLKVEHESEEKEEEVIDDDPDFDPPDECVDHDSENEADTKEVKKPTVIRFRKKEPQKPQKPREPREPEKRKECDQCGQKFRSWKKLKRHQLGDHGKVTMVKIVKKRREESCPECQGSFFSYKSMWAHAKRAHNLELPLPQNLVRCPYCEEVFHNSGSSLLASHLKEAVQA